jgi:hypothetical protein
MIRLIEMTRTIRLYGQCSHPKRITGTSTILLANGATHCVEIIEGHVNKAGRPQRLISFADSSKDGTLSEYFKSIRSSHVEIRDGAEVFSFAIERATVEIVGVCDEKATELRYRGVATPHVNPNDMLTLYETDSRDRRRFYIEAPPEVIARAMQCICDDGGCDLAMRSVSHS